MNDFIDFVNKKFVLSIVQLLNEEGLKETAHKLEWESGLYFDMKYFEELVLKGRWDDAETYLSGFTKIEDNSHSLKIYSELRTQKYFEALDNKDHARALDILIKDLKFISTDNEELYKELTQLLTMNNIREHPPLSTYGDSKSWRRIVMDVVKKLIEENPMFVDKLKFPSIDSQILRQNLPTALKLW